MKEETRLPEGRAGLQKCQLRELDSVRARALLARLDLEAHPLAPRQRVEVHGRIEASPVEEILPPVLGRDEPESAVGDQLLDGACRHLPTPFSKAMSRTHGPFENFHDRGEHRRPSGRLIYLPPAAAGRKTPQGQEADPPQ